MNIKTLKEITGLKNKDIANFFNLSLNSYESSSAKKKYENALVSFFEFTKNIDLPGEDPGEDKETRNVIRAVNGLNEYYSFTVGQTMLIELIIASFWKTKHPREPGEPDPTQTYLFMCNWCGVSDQDTPKFCKNCGNEINYEVKEL